MSADRARVEETTPDDETCMAGVARRQPEALKPLFARCAPLVFHMASQSLGAESAEDIVQDVFLSVWRKVDTFDPQRGSFRPWLLQVVHFRILNELRSRSRRPKGHGNFALVAEGRVYTVLPQAVEVTEEPRGGSASPTVRPSSSGRAHSSPGAAAGHGGGATRPSGRRSGRIASAPSFPVP